MKKTLSVIMAIVMVLTCLMGLATTVTAANEPSYAVSFNKQQAHRSDNVVMDISIKNNPGFVTLRFRIVYDQQALTMVKVEDTKLLKGWSQPSPTIKSPYILRWADSISSANNKNNGVIARVTFKVNSGATFDKTTVRVEHIESYQVDGNTVSFKNSSAQLSVVCSHSKTKEEIIKQPTHANVGSKNVICTICGQKVRTESIPALGHQFGKWTVKTAPTCTQKGLEERVCSCGANETRSISALGHQFGKWTVKTTPTCTQKGLEERVCSCGVKETRSVNAKGHTAGEWKIITDSTCTKTGEKILKCKVCGSTMETKKIPLKNHTPDKWQVIKEPNCTEEGLKTAKCKVCDKKYTATISALGHKANKFETVKEATCTEKGEKRSACTVCGAEFTEAIPELGHNYSEWKVVKEASETEEGIKERACSVCGNKEVEKLPKLDVTTEKQIEEIQKAPESNKKPIIYIISAVIVLLVVLSGLGYIIVKNKKKMK